MGWSHRGHGPLSVVGIGVLCAVGLQTGCKDEQPLAPVTLPAPPFLSEGEFTQTPTLAALQNQVVVFDLEPTGAGQATAEDVSRYALEPGSAQPLAQPEMRRAPSWRPDLPWFLWS